MDNKLLFPLLAVITGTLITIMVQFNTLLADVVGLVFSTFVIQLAGLLLSVVVIWVSAPPKGQPVNPLLRLGGILGVGMILINILCFQNIGASLTLAVSLLGRTLTSLAYDLTGFMGMTKYPLEKKKIAGLAASILGILLMAGRVTDASGYMLLAFLGGSILATQLIINARLALKIGLKRSTRNNFIVTAACSLILVIFLKIDMAAGFRALLSVSMFHALGSGWLGVIVVLLSSWIIPKIPTVYSSLLLFSGQFLSALIIDAVRFGSVSAGQLGGVLLILAGMLWNIRVDLIGVKQKEGLQQQPAQE